MNSASQHIVAVHVTPRSGRDEVMGIVKGQDDRREVQVRVTTAPDGGKANKAVCKVVAASIGVPKTAVSVVRGQTSRHKQLSIAADEHDVEAWYAGLGAQEDCT